MPFGNLAYCNDFTNLGISTFYNFDTFSTNKVSKLVGINWILETQAPLNLLIANCGGYGNTLVFQGRDTNSVNFNLILRYLNGSMNIIYNTIPNVSISVKDIAVDSNENIWFFTYQYSLSQPLYTLNEISNAGILINSYPVTLYSTFTLNNTYGLFILFNTLYIGVNYQDPIYPLKLIPINLVKDTAIMGTPISFIAPTNRFDLESCTQGTSTSVSEVPESLKELSVYPNPAENQFTVHLPYGSNRNAQLKIYNLQGKLIETKKASDTAPINCASWARGIYFVSLVEEGKAKVTRKIVVI